MGWVITKKDIPYISLGAKLLSCGGGGDTKSVEYLMLSIMKDSDVIAVKTIVEIMDEWIVPVAIAGSPVIFNEDIPSGTETVQTLKLYESVTRKNTDAVMSIEIGGINGLIPLLAALERNLPVIDGDGMGRAFPKLEMTSFYHSSVTAFPLVAYSNDETLIAYDQQQYEEKYQSFIFENSGYCHMACYGVDGQRLKAAMIPGTLKLARDLGKALSSGSIQEKLSALKRLFANSVYGELHIPFFGRIASVRRWFENKVLVGSCQLDGQLSLHGKTAMVFYQNEFLSMTVSGTKMFATPNLIIFLDYDTGMPVSVSEIHEGMFVLVLAVPAPSIMRTKEMLRLVGPQCFDIPDEFYPAGKNGGVLADEDWD
jgi:DUF917 family protein